MSEPLSATDEPVTIARFQFGYQAEAARLHLEAEGIRVGVQGAEIVAADWALGNAVGDVRVEVAARDAERARQILAPMTRPESERSAVPHDAKSSLCQACGAEIPAQEAVCRACAGRSSRDPLKKPFCQRCEWSRRPALRFIFKCCSVSWHSCSLRA